MAIFPKAGRPLARPPGARGALARPPQARAAANGPARAAPARSRPREAWLSLAGVSASGWRELGPALPRTAAQQGGPRLRPETAKPRAGRAPIWGINVSANQDEELDHETFLMQIDQETKKCTFYSSTGGYWTLVTHGGIQATATQVSANTMFEIEWHGRRVALKASNGRYVCMKKNGQLAAISDFVGEDELFILKLINRPILVLRGLDGFVCHRRGSNQLDTNRSTYDVFHLSFRDGAYQIRGRGGGFWYTGSHGSVCSDGDLAEDFLFEFRERGRLAIRALSGKYLRGGASGLLRADADLPTGEALWEY